MTANVLIHRNAFRVHMDIDKLQVQEGRTIYDILSEQRLVSDVAGRLIRNRPFLIHLNGQLILQKYWNTSVNKDDVLQVIYMPKGGGGGGSNISNIIVGIVAAVLAYFTFGLSLYASVAVGVAATVAMGLIAQPIPQPATSGLGNGRDTSSPTYNLSAQSNRARLLEAMPRVYGTMRTFPDLATQDYNEYRGNQQYLYQLFCVSLGRVRIDKILVDETDINSFEDAEYQIIEPGQAVTLFPDNVIVSPAVNNVELLAPDHPDYKPPVIFVISNNIAVNFIGVDISLPRGLGTVNDAGETASRTVSISFEYRNIDGGVWETYQLPPISMATQNPQVLSYKFEVPLGKYEVRARRNTGVGTNRVFDQVIWSTMRGYAPSIHTYGNCTLIAVAMRATNALNSNTAKKFSVISTSYLQAWNPIDGWQAAAPTNSIAWIAADILRNQDYGRGLATSRINIQNLYRLSQVWEERGDKFNGVFDSTSQLWDALKVVLRCGRTTPIYYAGIIDFIRDEPQTIVSGVFTPAKMVKGSFKVTYNFFNHETPDHIVVEYIDPVTFKTAEVTCAFPDSLKRNPSRIILKGCTNRDQAYREGMSLLAANRDRRKRVEFTTLKSGLIPGFNELIRIQHDVPQWGYSGRVLSFDRVTGSVRTTEPVPFVAGAHMVAFTRRDGSEDGPYLIIKDDTLNEGDSEYGFIVADTPENLQKIYISDGSVEDYTLYVAGPSERKGILALPQSCRPDSQGRVTISAINYADSVHTAENDGAVPPPPPESNLPSVDQPPIIDSVDVVYTVTVGVQNIVATVTRNAIYYEFQARMVNSSWQSLGTSDKPSLQANLSPGEWEIRVRGVGKVQGPWTTWIGTIEATSLPTSKLASFTTSPKTLAIGLNWTYDTETSSIAKAIEIRVGVTNVFGNSSPLVKLPYPANSYTMDNLAHNDTRYFWARVEDTAGRFGPWFNNGLSVFGTSEASPAKIIDALEQSIGLDQLTQELQEYIDEAGGSSIVVQELIDELSAMRTVKTQITANGEIYVAGYGLGISNDDGIVQSRFTVNANSFNVIDASNPQATPQLLFTVNEQGMFVRTAFIDKATIAEAIIGVRLVSQAKDSQGRPLIVLDMETGEFILRGQSSSGRMELNSETLKFWNGNNALPSFHAGDLLK